MHQLQITSGTRQKIVLVKSGHFSFILVFGTGSEEQHWADHFILHVNILCLFLNIFLIPSDWLHMFWHWAATFRDYLLFLILLGTAPFKTHLVFNIPKTSQIGFSVFPLDDCIFDVFSFKSSWSSSSRPPVFTCHWNPPLLNVTPSSTPSHLPLFCALSIWVNG